MEIISSCTWEVLGQWGSRCGLIKDPHPAQGAQVSPGPVPPGRLPASRAHLPGGQTTNLPHPAEAVTRSSPCLWRGRMSMLGHSDPQLSWSHRAGEGRGSLANRSAAVIGESWGAIGWSQERGGCQGQGDRHAHPPSSFGALPL